MLRALRVEGLRVAGYAEPRLAVQMRHYLETMNDK